MAMFKLTPKKSYRFHYRTTIKVRDVNYGGHLGNDAVVGLLHEARTDFLRSLGLTELDLGDGETGLIVSDLAVNYRAEGYLFDEIVVHSDIGEVRSTSFRVYHHVTRGDKTIALAEVGAVAFDYADRRIAELPEAFLGKIGHG